MNWKFMQLIAYLENKKERLATLKVTRQYGCAIKENAVKIHVRVSYKYIGRKETFKAITYKSELEKLGVMPDDERGYFFKNNLQSYLQSRLIKTPIYFQKDTTENK